MRGAGIAMFTPRLWIPGVGIPAPLLEVGIPAPRIAMPMTGNAG